MLSPLSSIAIAFNVIVFSLVACVILRSASKDSTWKSVALGFGYLLYCVLVVRTGWLLMPEQPLENPLFDLWITLFHIAGAVLVYHVNKFRKETS